MQAKSTNHPAAQALLIVYIDDINDNGPKFVKTAYYAEVMENSKIGTSVLTVSATDADVEVCLKECRVRNDNNNTNNYYNK